MVLVLLTFRLLLQFHFVIIWNSNQGVAHAILSGGGVVPEVNACVGRVWTLIAQMQSSVRIGRVERRADVADGPTRFDLQWINRLHAVFVDPQVPDWLLNPWQRCFAPWVV